MHYRTAILATLAALILAGCSSATNQKGQFRIPPFGPVITYDADLKTGRDAQ